MPKHRKTESDKPKANKLKAFICVAQEDLSRARQIYAKLKDEGWIEPWLYLEDIPGGQHYKWAINKAMLDAHVIIICMSRISVVNEGYFQTEITIALDIAKNAPEGTNFIIPLKLDKCEIPKRLISRTFLNYFNKTEKSYEKLLQSLKFRAEAKDIPINTPQSDTKCNEKQIAINALASSSNTLDIDYATMLRKLGELTLDEEFLSFDSPDSRSVTRVVFVLARLLELDEQYIVIKDIELGSIKILIELPEKAYEHLASLVEKKDKELFRLFNVKSFRSAEKLDAAKSTLDVRELETESSKPPHTFVGRRDEISVFRRLLENPDGKQRIALILGGGGMGQNSFDEENVIGRTGEGCIGT